MNKKPLKMIPGEVITQPGEIILNKGVESIDLEVKNSGDRPIQVCSHFHFFEANEALLFDREATKGFRLDIPAGTGIRFEPGQSRKVSLIPYRGKRIVFGFNAKIMGPL